MKTDACHVYCRILREEHTVEQQPTVLMSVVPVAEGIVTLSEIQMHDGLRFFGFRYVVNHSAISALIAKWLTAYLKPTVQWRHLCCCTLQTSLTDLGFYITRLQSYQF